MHLHQTLHKNENTFCKTYLCSPAQYIPLTWSLSVSNAALPLALLGERAVPPPTRHSCTAFDSCPRTSAGGHIRGPCLSRLVPKIVSLKTQSHVKNFTWKMRLATLYSFMKLPNQVMGYDSSVLRF